MELRHAFSVVGISLSAFLTTGCLLYKDSSRAESQTRELDERIAYERSANVLKDDAQVPPIVLPPPLPSNYNPHPVPTPGSLTSLVELDGKGVQLTATPLVRSKSAGDEPPALAPVPVVAESPLVSAFRCALQKHPQEARQLLDGYVKDDREMLMGFMKVTAGIAAKEIAKLTPAEMERVEVLIARLRQRAPLSLGRVCFCRKIDGFGQFEELPASHPFQPGSEGRPGDRVYIYAELRNFASQQTADSKYEETTLSSSVRIVDDVRQREVAAVDLGPCVDRCRSRRQDYFLNAQFHVPANLPVGIYTLHLRVEDKTPGVIGDRKQRIASRSLSFRVGAVGVVTASP